MKQFLVFIYIEDRFISTFPVWSNEHWITNGNHIFSTNNEIILMLQQSKRIKYEVEERGE